MTYSFNLDSDPEPDSDPDFNPVYPNKKINKAKLEKVHFRMETNQSTSAGYNIKFGHPLIRLESCIRCG